MSEGLEGSSEFARYVHLLETNRDKEITAKETVPDVSLIVRIVLVQESGPLVTCNNKGTISQRVSYSEGGLDLPI
jgi:hypothetical protein